MAHPSPTRAKIQAGFLIYQADNRSHLMGPVVEHLAGRKTLMGSDGGLDSVVAILEISTLPPADRTTKRM